MTAQVPTVKSRLSTHRSWTAPALLAVAIVLASACLAGAQTLDCSQATVIVSAHLSTPEASAVEMLIDEAAKRTGHRWDTEHSFRNRAPGCAIFAATRGQMLHLLPAALSRSPLGTPQAAEAFSLHAIRFHFHPVIIVTGNDDRGLLFGAGALLRMLSLSPGSATLPGPLHRMESPEKPIRSHQLGYRFKNNTYDAWNLAQFEQQIRDLAVFGANTVQLIAPVSDDQRTSPLFPAPPLDTLLGISRILDRYGLNCDIYYPEMEADYSSPAAVARDLARFDELFRQIPRVDALWIPGGDPGHTPPALLFPLIAQQAVVLHRYHPKAKVYVSAQGMNAEQYEDFYRLVGQHPDWLSGVFFGPQSRDCFETQRQRIPADIPLVFYPDIAHTMHAQFPVSQWDPVFALTEGREPIDPRPEDEAAIYRHFAALHTGFVTYSEGVNDDVNKILWTRWGWAASTPVQTILEEYGRFFIGPAWSKPVAHGIIDLERNWRGPLRLNRQIEQTLREFQAIEKSSDAPRDNWRFELALYRAYYDAFLQRRLAAETLQQDQALEPLRHTSGPNVSTALLRAEAALLTPLAPSGSDLRTPVFDLAGKLFHHIGLQLSVKLYGASNWERGANLDRIDIPLNDRVWLQREFMRIGALPADRRSTAIDILLDWDSPVPGALYDDLGNPERESHLVRGQGLDSDPEMYRTAIDGVADRTPEDGWRWSELTYAETLYEFPLELRYTGLNSNRHYCLRVTYSGEDYTLPLRLVANHTLEIHPARLRKANPETVEFEIPEEATRTGELSLEWARPDGLGGGGRGRQVAEVWLLPVNSGEKSAANPEK
jgi:hypothetical protein